MARRIRSAGRRFRGHMRNRLLAGLLVVIPLVITYFVLSFLFQLVEGQMQPLLERLGTWRIPALGVEGSWNIPGLGVVVILVLLYLIGTLVATVLGTRIVSLGHRLLENIPVVRTVYRAARQATDSLSVPRGTYSRVVLVEYPRPGIKALGLVTGEVETGGQRRLAVYIPTAFNPSSGFLALVPKEETESTDITVEEAMRIILSAGLLIPPSFNKLGSTEEPSLPQRP